MAINRKGFSQQLLTAALIAIALASPVRGEIVGLTCSDLIDLESPGLRLDIEMNQFSAVAYGAAPRSLDLLSFSDTHISWVFEDHDWGEEGNYFVAVYVLNRTNLVLTLNYVGLDDYNLFQEMDMNLGRSFYQCTRPL